VANVSYLASATSSFTASARRTRATDFLRRQVIRLERKKKWPHGGLPVFGFPSNRSIEPALQAEEGRALAVFQVGPVGRRVRAEKYEHAHFSDLSVDQAADAIRAWAPQPKPEWIAGMVSDRRPHLVPDFARRLAATLRIPYVDAFIKIRASHEQKTMENAPFRAKNLDGTLEIAPFDGMERPGLLVDDMHDSGWTATVAIALLRRRARAWFSHSRWQKYRAADDLDRRNHDLRRYAECASAVGSVPQSLEGWPGAADFI
jgi:ATP-dependent DNA helicase RecQ